MYVSKYELEKNLNLNLEYFFLKYVGKVLYLSNLDLFNEKWRIKKYKKNEGFFDWHVDNVPHYKNRLLAVIYYLNDLE